MSKLTYTKAIQNNKLSTSKMEIGSSVTGTVTGTKEGKYGTVYTLDINGRTIDLYPSGNLKKAKELSIGNSIVITRADDVQTKNGYSMTNFEISTTSNNNTSNSAGNTSVKARLQQIRNEGTNG